MKTHLPLYVCLGLAVCSLASLSAVQITFGVNMSVQASLGVFDPDADTVFVAGDPINGWSTTASELTRSSKDANIWEGTFDVPGAEGAAAQYKFLMTTAAATIWEGAVGTGGGTGNRTFTLPATDQALPVVYFNNVTGSNVVTSQVTFQVDMSIQIALGNFDRESGTVNLAGEFNAWNASALALTNSLSNSNVWFGVVTLSGAADTTVSYKFVINGSSWEGNVGVGGSQNRMLTLKSTDQVLPVVYFNNLAVLPGVIPLSFEVDMSAQIALGTFDPEAGTMSVAGDTLNNWSATASALSRSATETNVWTGTFDLTSAPGAVILYKFVMNDGATWERIENRPYTIASTNAQTIPRAYFNNTNHIGNLAMGAVSGRQATLSWTSGPLIRLQTSTALGATWQDVPDTLGQGAATITLGTGSAYFRLKGP